MHTNRQDGSIGWKTIAAALGLGTVVVMVSVMLLGSQVSKILSTVGSSIGGPYGGGYEQPGDPGTVGGDGSGSDGAGGEGPDGAGGEEPDGAGTDGSGSGPYGGPGPAPGSGVVLAVPRDDILVIKTGHITIQVADVTPAVTAATNGIDALGGYASGSKRSGAADDLRATVTFRIPSAQWDAALNVLRATGTVLDEETSTDDVTTEVVDLGARIRNLQVTEQALQSIMDKASVVKDVLTVQEELTSTRSEIEQLTAQKAHLEEQAAFSTLTATFQVTPAPAVVVAQTRGFDPANEVDAATAKLIRGLQKVAKAGIWFGIVWLPILLVLLIGGSITFVVGRRLMRWLGPTRSVDFVEVRSE